MAYKIYLTNTSGSSEVTVPIWLPGSSLESCQLIGATLNQELNRAAVLTFTMPPTNAGYAAVVPMKSTVTVYDGDTVIFIGRPISVTNDFYNCKKIICEDPLAWLNDGIMRPYAAPSMANLIDRISGTTIYTTGYNSQAAPERQIWFPRIYGSFGTFEAESDDYTTFLDVLQKTALPAFGDEGWISLDYTPYGNAAVQLSLLSTAPASGQEIRFGKNLLDLEDCIDPTDLYTVLIPLGKDVDTGQTDPETGAAVTAPLTIESVEEHGRDWIMNTAARDSFGQIAAVARYPEIEDAAELLSAAEADLTAHSAVANRLEISAVDLSRIGVSVGALRVGYTSAVTSPHGASGTYRCTKVAADLMNPEKTRYTFGAAGKLFTASQVTAQADQARRTALAAKEAASAKGTAIAAGAAAKEAQDGVDELSEEIGERTDTGSGGGGSSGSGSGSSSDPTLWAVANRAYALAGEALDTADGAIAAIPAGATQAPLMDGTAAVGSSAKWAREDHVHPTDTTRAAASDIPTAVSELTNDAGYQTKADVIELLTPIWTALGTGPLILEQPEDNSGAVDDTVPFSVLAIGTGLTYQWQYCTAGSTTWRNSSSATVGYNTDTLQVVATAARNGYQYRCKVTDGNGNSVTSSAATLTVS